MTMHRKKALFVILNLVLLAVLFTFAGWREKQAEWRHYNNNLVQLTLPDGRVERCLTCHQGIAEISPSHPIETFGCVSCHGGDGLALDKDRAHQGLRGGRNPSALSVAADSCGKEGCHVKAGSLYRSPVKTVPLVPMATKAGEITEVSFAHGWQKDWLSRYAVVKVADISGVDREALAKNKLASAVFREFEPGDHPGRQKLSQNCLSNCHLNTGRESNPKAAYLQGCAACHTPYNLEDTYQGEDPTIDRTEPGHAARHKLTAVIPYTQCNSCHNQGVHSVGRLKFYFRNDVSRQEITDPKADRDKTYYIPLTQYAACEVELDCIDCHTRNEVMGNGHLAGNKYVAQTIRCYNCHGTKEREVRFAVIDSQNHDAVWASQYFAEKFPPVEPGDVVAFTDENEPMINVRREDGQIVLYSKISGKRYVVPQVKDSNCRQSVDRQAGADCHTCHDVAPKN